MVKNSAANAGDTSSIPGPGRSHLPQSNEACEPELLSLCSGAREQQLLKPARPRARAPQQQNTLQREAWAPKLERSLHGSEDPAQPKRNK